MRTRTITSALVTAALLACVGGTTAVAACFGLCDGNSCPGLFCGCAGTDPCTCAAAGSWCGCDLYCPESEWRCAGAVECSSLGGGCGGVSCNQCGWVCPTATSLCFTSGVSPAPCPCAHEGCPDNGNNTNEPLCGGSRGMCYMAASNPQLGDLTPCGAEWKEVQNSLRWDGGHGYGCACQGEYCQSGRDVGATPPAPACAPCLNAVAPANKPCGTQALYDCTCLTATNGEAYSRPCAPLQGKPWDCQNACWRVVCWSWDFMDPDIRVLYPGECDCQCGGAIAPPWGGGTCDGGLLTGRTYHGQEIYYCGYDNGFPFGPDGTLSDSFGCDGVPQPICCHSCSNGGTTAGTYAYNCTHPSCAEHCASLSNQVCGGGVGNQIDMCDCPEDDAYKCYRYTFLLVHTHYGRCKACTAKNPGNIKCSDVPDGCQDMGW
jgi:hypothetical protein